MHLVTQLEAEAHGKTAKPAHFFDRGLPSPRAESNSCCPTNANLLLPESDLVRRVETLHMAFILNLNSRQNNRMLELP